MESTAEILFRYLHKAIYDPLNASLDIDALPEEFRDFGQGLQYYADCVQETKMLANSLSRGDLHSTLPLRSNEIAAPLKALHSSLMHLTWQAQQIAQGDYKQRVNFMGEFADAFNTMVEQLAERESNLKDTIVQIQIKQSSLEQSNQLLTTLMHYVPQQILVIDTNTQEVLLMNEVAAKVVHGDPEYMDYLFKIMSIHDASDKDSEIEFTYSKGSSTRYFIVKSYSFEWNFKSSEILAISDITATKSKIDELEIHAYEDSITRLYNRTYGMIVLDSWLHEKRKFVLVFSDLDSLKFINDEFGHAEGDIYIINAAKHLKTFSPEAVVCRIGGDEFMVLAQDMDYNEANYRMNKIYMNFKNDSFLDGKVYAYSISFGVVAVDRDNKASASEILSLADERMYENKRMRKRARMNNPE